MVKNENSVQTTDDIKISVEKIVKMFSLRTFSVHYMFCPHVKMTHSKSESESESVCFSKKPAGSRIFRIFFWMGQTKWFFIFFIELNLILFFLIFYPLNVEDERFQPISFTFSSIFELFPLKIDIYDHWNCDPINQSKWTSSKIWSVGYLFTHV